MTDEGWNADPYTGREFHGVWGDFDVKITLEQKVCGRRQWVLTKC